MMSQVGRASDKFVRQLRKSQLIRRTTDNKPLDCCYVFKADIIIRHAGFMLISDIVNKEGYITKFRKEKSKDYFPECIFDYSI